MKPRVSSGEVETVVGQSNIWDERLGEIATVYGKHCGVKGQPTPLDALRATVYILLPGF
jgi:hypothetical protein